MNLPLYKSAQGAFEEAQDNPNASLVFDHFATWNEKWESGGSDKRRFYDKVSELRADAELLEAFHERRDRQVDALGGVTLEAETLGKLVSGLGVAHPFETGFVWHGILGVPCVSGSGVKGAVRAWADQWIGKAEEAERLFGTSGETGKLILMDAVPGKPSRLKTDVMTPHFGEYYSAGKAPGDYISPVPVTFLTVTSGCTFRFPLLARDPGDKESLDLGKAFLKDALENIGLGAKTSSGYGTFAVKEPRKDLRFDQMRQRIQAQNPNDIGSVSALVSDLENLPTTPVRMKLADLIYDHFLSDGKKRRKHRDKPWFQRLQQMRDTS